MADNLVQDNLGNQDQQSNTVIVEGQAATTTKVPDAVATTTDVKPVTTDSFSWKSKLAGDLAKAPNMQKFEDTPEGLSKAMESYQNLEKLLGHEKVPIPKDANDAEGWARFNKAMGVPDNPIGYKLNDVSIPDSMKGLSFDKKQFAEVMHSIHATPQQAAQLWGAYTKLNMESYNKALDTQKQEMTRIVNELKQEWGDAYDGNVELGQMVINKFSADKETADEISAMLLTNPKAIKFLAKIGEQFAENKIGEFSAKRFGLSPEQADAEIQAILKDPKHAYNDPKASKKEHEAAIEYVNSLYLTKNKGKL